MRKVDDGKKEKKRKEEKNDVFSGHYVIASSLPPERLRPNDDRWNASRLCQNQPFLRGLEVISQNFGAFGENVAKRAGLKD